MPLQNHHMLHLPKPILFHPLKHHLYFIKQFILESATAPDEALKASLSTIGGSQLDFYTGRLSIEGLAQEVIAALATQDVLQPEAYKLYLGAAGKDYRTITLSDDSVWVLRLGVIAERHVHLHPARYSANTIRVKATALKTAIAALIAAKRTNLPVTDVDMINRVRAQWLNLPPVGTARAANADKLIDWLTQ